MKLLPEDQDKVAAAIKRAEEATDGEINAVSALSSDSYHDVVLHWSLLVALLPLAVWTAWPHLLVWAASLLDPWSPEPPLRLMLTLALIKVALAFLVARWIFGLPRMRMLLTPGSTKQRRVRARAILLFRAGTEKRTATRTGVLLYLSLAERRAEIVADETIHAKVAPEVWGEAMAALIAALKDGRPGDGIAAAIERIGAVLAEHFPHTGTDPNEMPDRLIEL
jgi:putative membrane protein